MNKHKVNFEMDLWDETLTVKANVLSDKDPYYGHYYDVDYDEIFSKTQNKEIDFSSLSKNDQDRIEETCIEEFENLIGRYESEYIDRYDEF